MIYTFHRRAESVIRFTEKEPLMFKGECFKYQVQLDYFSSIASLARNHAIYSGSYFNPEFSIELFPFLQVLPFFPSLMETIYDFKKILPKII